MSLEFYRVLHVTGLALVLLGAGATLLVKDAPRKLAMALHGIGLLVMFGAGFGAMAKLGLGSPSDWPAWLILKMVIWFLVASIPALVRHGTVPRPLGWILVVLLVACAAWLAIVKPDFGG